MAFNCSFGERALDFGSMCGAQWLHLDWRRNTIAWAVGPRAIASREENEL